MARIARVIVPGLPHHVTQRGVRSMDVFRDDADREEYLRLLGEQSERFGVSFLAWCLMTNHVHLIAVPKREDSLARAVGEAHRLYTRMVNFAEGVRGHLFQERFGSYPVQRDRHLLAAARYVDMNPVSAGMVTHAAGWKWSSAPYHLGRVESDPLVEDRTLLGLADDWKGLLTRGAPGAPGAPGEPGDPGEIELHLRTGRPWGGERFVAGIEKRLGRDLVPARRGWPKGKKRQGPRGKMTS